MILNQNTRTKIAKSVIKSFLTVLLGSGFVGNLVFNGYEFYEQNKILKEEARESHVFNVISYLQETNLYKNSNFQEIKQRLANAGFEIKNKKEEIYLKNIINDLLNKGKTKSNEEVKE